MAVAMIYPDKQQGRKRTSEQNSVVSGRYINRARTVLEYAPALADSVLAGGSLYEAHDKALKRKKDDASEESQLADKVVVNPVPWTDAAASARRSSVQLACHRSGMARRGSIANCYLTWAPHHAAGHPSSRHSSVLARQATTPVQQQAWRTCAAHSTSASRHTPCRAAYPWLAP